MEYTNMSLVDDKSVTDDLVMPIIKFDLSIRLPDYF